MGYLRHEKLRLPRFLFTQKKFDFEAEGPIRSQRISNTSKKVLEGFRNCKNPKSHYRIHLNFLFPQEVLTRALMDNYSLGGNLNKFFENLDLLESEKIR